VAENPEIIPFRPKSKMNGRYGLYKPQIFSEIEKRVSQREMRASLCLPDQEPDQESLTNPPVSSTP
jgi:hypothetical protein